MSTGKKINNKLYDFATSIVGNQVLDIYLKYNGIESLTTATLMPMALILGKEEFLKNIKNQKGGFISNKMPVIGDPLIGSYLKLAGISTFSSFNGKTLVPIGLLMFLYNLHENSVQTGGKRDPNIIMNYINKVWGNRILDLFIKYKGITMLTPNTMVPLGLILGVDYLEDIFKNPQTGGGYQLPDDIPIIDDKLIGNYLKLMGISSLTLSPNLLLPLGLVALLYHTYIEN